MQLSKIQFSNYQDKLDIAKGIIVLHEIHQRLLKKMSEVDFLINKKVGPKGDSPTREQIASIVRPMLQNVTNSVLLSLIKPLIPKPKDGSTPTKEELLSLIMPLIPKVQDGKDAIITSKHISIIADIASKKVMEMNPGQEIDPTKIIQMILDMPEGQRLSMKHINGLEQTIRSFKEQLDKKHGGYLHGGGDTVKAGTNITITINTDGTKTISATGGVGAPVDPTSGVIDGMNITFTFAKKPTLIVNDNATYRENKGWTWDSGTNTATLAVPPNYDLYAL